MSFAITLPKSANFECDSSIAYQTEPQLFGFDFEPRGNFTITWADIVINKQFAKSIFVNYLYE